MTAGRRLEVLLRRGALSCSAGAAVLGLAGLSSWLLGWRDLSALGPAYVPMAPLTAILLALLGSAVALRIKWPQEPLTVRYGVAVSLATVTLCLWISAVGLGMGSFSVESLLFGAGGVVNGIALGRMAPLTAMAFLMCAAALALRLPPLVARRRFRWVGGALAGTILLISFGVVLGYASGAPVQYGGGTVPMALLTAVAFGMLGAGLLLWTAATSRLVTPPDGLLRSAAPVGRFEWQLIGVFLFLAAAISLSGWLYLRRQQEQARKSVQAGLDSIAELKVRQISSWRSERLADARFAMQVPSLARDLEVFLSRPPSPARSEMEDWLKLLEETGRYKRVALFDSRQVARLEVPPSAESLGPEAREVIDGALRTSTITISDLHRGGDAGAISLYLACPVFPPGRAPGSSPIGAILFQVDPYEFLYPLIQSWPTPSRSAESLLVRREGGSVLYLNELRHARAAALRLRQPLASPRLPEAMALRGETVAEGEDYRGVPVLASVRRIQDSHWVLVAKVDQDEIFAPLRRQAFVTALVIGFLLVVVALAVGLIWWESHADTLHKELASEQAREKERRDAADEIRELNVELEGRVRERTAQLEASNRDLQKVNKELEAFSYSVSHDLRAPVRAVDGFTAMLERRCGYLLDAEGHRLLGVMRKESKRMGLLIDDLLEFSRMSRHEMQRAELDMTVMARQVFAECAASTGQREVRLRLSPLPSARCDAAMVRQLWTNLIANAVKFTDPKEDALIEIASRQEDLETVYFVKDNGVGFDMRYVNKLFGIFQRLHRQDEFEGTGVGLALVKRIVERHGGRVWAEGRPGEGATFSFTLPERRDFA